MWIFMNLLKELLVRMMMMNRTIESDAQHALTILNLDISDVLLSRGTRSIMDKKKLLYCYLRLECGYSWHEIGTYCNKDHTTILKVVNKHIQSNTIQDELTPRIETTGFEFL